MVVAFSADGSRLAIGPAGRRLRGAARCRDGGVDGLRRDTAAAARAGGARGGRLGGRRGQPHGLDHRRVHARAVPVRARLGSARGSDRPPLGARCRTGRVECGAVGLDLDFRTARALRGACDRRPDVGGGAPRGVRLRRHRVGADPLAAPLRLDRLGHRAGLPARAGARRRAGRLRSARPAAMARSPRCRWTWSLSSGCWRPQACSSCRPTGPWRLRRAVRCPATSGASPARCC